MLFVFIAVSIVLLAATSVSNLQLLEIVLAFLVAGASPYFPASTKWPVVGWGGGVLFFILLILLILVR